MIACDMSKNWKRIQPGDLEENVFQAIGEGWMLITAGAIDRWNTMTASWGSMGILWGKSVCFCFVRDSRYTYEFMNDSDSFTLSFFEETHRPALNYCGSHSGRDVDKAKETGLVPLEIDGCVTFEQARLSIVCKKIYYQDIDPGHFVDPSIHDHYSKKDYHRMYIGEIAGCYAG
jgi:flavin reductase (DIM6/NTAB) family NADH-FMN oxidoreductase RutF